MSRHGISLFGRFFKTDENGNKVLGKDGKPIKIAVPAPSTDPDSQWVTEYVRANAADLGRHFDFALWAPLWMAQGGSGEGCDGFGISHRRNFGWTGATRYSPNQEEVLSAFAALEARGVENWHTMPAHQLLAREQGGPGISYFPGPDGKTMDGAGATQPSWFRGHCSWNAEKNTWNDPIPPFSPQDTGMPDAKGDNPFGRETCPEHSRACFEDTLDWIKWGMKRTGAKGFWADDAKGWSTAKWAEIMEEVGAPCCAEFFDGDSNWIYDYRNKPPMSGRCAVMDFPGRWRIQRACNNYDAQELDRGIEACWQRDPEGTYVFGDDHDTDGADGQQIINNKLTGYAYMASLPTKGILVFGKDYFPQSFWPGAYGMKPRIDNILWVTRMFAIGKLQRLWVDRNVYSIWRDGDGGAYGWSGGMITDLNFDTQAEHWIETPTPFGPNAWVHDYSGNSTQGDLSTDSRGNLRRPVPRNVNSSGRGFAMWARGGVTAPARNVSRPITQVWMGRCEPGAKLDVYPAMNGTRQLRERIRVKPGTSVKIGLSCDTTAWGADGAVEVMLLDLYGLPLGAPVRVNRNFTSGTTTIPASPHGRLHSVRVTGFGLPAGGSNMDVAITYTGTEQD